MSTLYLVALRINFSVLKFKLFICPLTPLIPAVLLLLITQLLMFVFAHSIFLNFLPDTRITLKTTRAVLPLVVSIVQQLKSWHIKPSEISDY